MNASLAPEALSRLSDEEYLEVVNAVSAMRPQFDLFKRLVAHFLGKIGVRSEEISAAVDALQVIADASD